MNILLLCNDHWHPAEVPAGGVAPLEAKGYKFKIITDSADFGKENLDNYAVVMLCKGDQRSHMTHEPWITQKIQDAFVEYVENGGGLLVIHGGTVPGKATDTLSRLMGCRFTFHPNNCPVTVAPILPHPITNGVETFTEIDEHYRLEILSDDIKAILASYSPPQGGLNRIQEDPYHNTTAWIGAAGLVRTQGKGRICVLTPGHLQEVWLNGEFQKILNNSLTWCAGQSPKQIIAEPEKDINDTGKTIEIPSETPKETKVISPAPSPEPPHAPPKTSPEATSAPKQKEPVGDSFSLSVSGESTAKISIIDKIKALFSSDKEKKDNKVKKDKPVKPAKSPKEAASLPVAAVTPDKSTHPVPPPPSPSVPAKPTRSASPPPPPPVSQSGTSKVLEVPQKGLKSPVSSRSVDDIAAAELEKLQKSSAPAKPNNDSTSGADSFALSVNDSAAITKPPKPAKLPKSEKKPKMPKPAKEKKSFLSSKKSIDPAQETVNLEDTWRLK